MRMVSRLLLLALLAIAPAITSATADEPVQDDIEGWTATCRDAMGKLGKALKAELQAAVKAEGDVGALRICNLEAVPITETISTEDGLLIGRTSLKTRNPANIPDVWERSILEEFASRRESGESATDLEAWTIITDEIGHRTFRYMRAIPTAPMCLKCHGRRLNDDIAAKIAELYPDDRATGFKAGDVRGAFTVMLPVD